MMFAEYEAQIRAEALAAVPNEAVWLITEKGCRLVENISATPTTHFEVSQSNVARATAEGLLAVVHSHAHGDPVPSEVDMHGQLASSVPWGIVATNGVTCEEIVWWGDGVPKAPLVGRGFRHGVTDCYALVRDYYKMERGVDLPEFPRGWNWWNLGEELFTTGFEKAGFVRINQDEVEEGDVWLAQLRSDVPNHAGILLGQGLAIHQAGSTNAYDPTRLSVREPVARYMPHITHWLRYAP